MGREKDRFWEYVEESDGSFLCEFCKRQFSRVSITRIKSHFAGIGGRNIQICRSVPDDVQLAAYQSITAHETGETNEFHSTSRRKGKRPLQFVEPVKDKSQVDKMLARFIIANRISLDVLKTPYLIDLLKSMAQLGSSYVLPNLDTLLTQLIPDIYEEAEEHVNNVKKYSTTTGCSLVLSNVVKKSKLESVNVFAQTPIGLVYVKKIVVPEGGIAFNDFLDGIFEAIEFFGS